MCTVWVADVTHNMTSLASAYILAAFTVEVYVAIVHPVRHKAIFSHRFVALLVAIAWLIGITYPLGVYLGIARVLNGVCNVLWGWPAVALPMSIVNFFVRMCIPILFYTVSYALTFVFLRKKSRIAIHRLNAHSISASLTTRAGERRQIGFFFVCTPTNCRPR